MIPGVAISKVIPFCEKETQDNRSLDVCIAIKLSAPLINLYPTKPLTKECELQ